MGAAASSTMLSQKEAHHMLMTRITPQTAFASRLTQFSSKQCHMLDVPLNETFLPLLTVNRRMPRAVVHGPVELGGMNLPMNHLAMQDQWNIHYMIQTVRWNGITARDLLTVLNAYQLCSGFVSHVLINTEPNLDYVVPTTRLKLKYINGGLIHHVRNRLQAIKGELHFERAWAPK